MFLYSMLTEKEEELKKQILEAQQLEQALRKEIFDESALRTASAKKTAEKSEPIVQATPPQNVYYPKERKEEPQQTQPTSQIQQTITPESGMRQMFMMRDMIDTEQIPLVDQATVIPEEPVAVSPEPVAAVTERILPTEDDNQPAQETVAPPQTKSVQHHLTPAPRSEEYAENVRNNDDRNKEILRLHREGLSNVEIAKKLNLGQGEVKLVIGLYEGIRR